MTRKRLAIIGNGMAAGRLLDELLRRGGQDAYDLTVFGEEPHGCYNRILLGRVLAGGSADDIMLKPRAWYAERGVRFHAGLTVTAIDPTARRLTCDDGSAHAYDVAVFATGSAPYIPPTEGLTGPDGRPRPGVFLFRTVADCERMRAAARPASSAVVLGGGLLGLEAAAALCERGLRVTVVHKGETLLNAQVDPTGGRMVRRAVERLGVFVRTGRVAEAVLGADRVEAIRLTGGEVLPADLIVIACGIRPRSEVAQASGVPTRRGILVNDCLATSVPGVYAVGECAEHAGKVYGLVQPVWEQCAVLADVLTGADPQARYYGSKVYARLKVAGVEVASMGLVEPEHELDEVVQVLEERRGVYRKLVVRDGRLAGAMLVGDTTTAAALVQWFDRGDPLPSHRLDVLCSPAVSPATADPEICNCHRVRESTLRAAVAAGCTTLAKLADETKAGTGCGSCRGQLADLILRMNRAAATSVRSDPL